MNARVRIPRRQSQGFTLILAILLLLILTIFSLSALNVGVFEQRTSANDYRSKVVHQVAEVGLNHASEAIRMLENDIMPDMGQAVDAALWQRCDGADTSFPCGAEPDAARRANMYRYIGGVDLDGDGAISTFERRSINFPNTVEGGAARRLLQTTVPGAGGTTFAVEYAVGALLCRIDIQSNPSAVGNNPCITAPLSRAGRLNAITLVSRAEMVGEQASATVSRSIVPIVRIGINPDVPAITASGIIRGLGTSTIVGNPNAGGPGVLISIWSRTDFEGGNGSWQTCHLDDWIRNSDIGVFQDQPICVGNGNACGCPADTQLSGGGVAGNGEGLDTLDVDNNTPGNYNATTRGTLMDSTSFPCDLMEFVFGEVRARNDTNNDGFCDTGIDANGDGDIDVAVDFIRNVLQAQELDCTEFAALDSTATGTYWVSEDGCSFPGRRVGTPNAPVILIVDGGIDATNGMEVFGLVFGRDPRLVLPADGGNAGWAPGGGSGAIYGAAVIEGGGTVNGNIDIIYNARSLGGGAATGDPVVGEIPGSWTDRFSY